MWVFLSIFLVVVYILFSCILFFHFSCLVFIRSIMKLSIASMQVCPRVSSLGTSGRCSVQVGNWVLRPQCSNGGIVYLYISVI